MAEIGVASGIVALAAFAFKSSKFLFEAINNVRNNSRVVRELKNENESLTLVLKSLCETVAKSDVEMVALELPLLRCGKACEEFGAAIKKSTAHSTDSRASFRDWTRLRYMGDDIAGFRNTLASYKSTISIALADFNM